MVVVGFGETPCPQSYPSRDTLSRLIADGCDPRLIWRTVIVSKLVDDDHPVRLQSHWAARVRWVQANPEPLDQLLFERDSAFDARGSSWIILFDALDRSASNWTTMNRLIRGLLEAALDMRPYRRLRVKCFLRSDQVAEGSVADFPDASKILATKVDLSWPARELYGLLWQYLLNSDAETLREHVRSNLGLNVDELRLQTSTVWRVPDRLNRDEKLQRTLFHTITGPFMGRDRRRGFPYTWVPNHLADTHGRASPRSFLAALREAAEHTQSHYPNHDRPLHYESIKCGVKAASRIRVTELQEDYPWVHALMKPLKGKVVPCLFDEISEAWKQDDTLRRLEHQPDDQEGRLPPAHLGEGATGIREDLERLGIFLRLSDGRVNIPDVFRVGYGLGRRGGVKPVSVSGGG